VTLIAIQTETHHNSQVNDNIIMPWCGSLSVSPLLTSTLTDDLTHSGCYFVTLRLTKLLFEGYSVKFSEAYYSQRSSHKVVELEATCLPTSTSTSLAST